VLNIIATIKDDASVGPAHTLLSRMIFFITCMADMLSAKHFTVDQTSIFDLPEQAKTPFSSTLRDMIAVYSVSHSVATSWL
jgi:hypothetical protein